jgi:hypothetical protein
MQFAFGGGQRWGHPCAQTGLAVSLTYRYSKLESIIGSNLLMPALSVNEEFVKRFEKNHESCRMPTQNKALVQHKFIDTFFKALGWDINNEKSYTKSYIEVIYYEL